MNKERNGEKNKTLIVRPTLIIGIGGTGCLAVKHVKECFHDQIGQFDLPFVKFLVIDSTTEESYGLKLNEAGEYINLGNIDVNDVIDHIEEYPHLQKWFPHEQIEPMQAGLGAGGVRQIGRLYYFQWRESEKIRSKIKSYIELLMNPRLPDDTNQIEKVKALNLVVDLEHGIDVHIVSSVVGGTGSGILLDLAYDLRRWCKEGAGMSNISAHFVLPEAFDKKVHPRLHNQLRANAYACLSEINHFIQHGKWEVKYQEETVQEASRSPFDYIYLLNGELEVGLRDHYEITSVIGKMIATLVVTPLGNAILKHAVNISQNVLGQSDERHREPQAYASYGIATAVLSSDKLAAATEHQLAQQIINQALALDDATAQRIVQEANHTDVSLEKIRENLPQISKITWDQQGAGDDNDILQGCVDKYYKDNEEKQLQEKANWQEKLSRLFSTDFDDHLHRQLLELWQNHLSLAGLAELIEAQLSALTQLKEQSEDEKNKLATQRQQSENEIQALRADPNTPLGIAGLPTYAELLCKLEQAQYWRAFWDTVVELIAKLFQRINHGFKAQINLAVQICHDMQKKGAGNKSEKTPLSAESFEFCSPEEIAGILAKARVSSSLKKFGRNILQNLGNSTVQSELHWQNDWQELLKKIVAEEAAEIVKEYALGQGLDIHKFAESAELLDDNVLGRKVQQLVNAARPSVRFVGNFPKYLKQDANYIGINLQNHHLASADLESSRMFRIVRDIDAGFQTAPHNFCEIPIVSLLYGFPLWALRPAVSWEQAFDLKQKQNGNAQSQVFLDPSWQNEIRPFIPLSIKASERILYFSLAAMESAGLIVENKFKEWRLDQKTLGRSRYDAFVEFESLLSRNGVYSFDGFKERVRKKLGKSKEEIVRGLDKHLQELKALAAKEVTGLNAKLLVQEIRLVEEESRRLSS